MTLDERIAAAPWRATKRLQPPHEYVMSHFTPEMPQFIIDMESQIIERGFDARFFRSRAVFRYWEHDGYKYGAPGMNVDTIRQLPSAHGVARG